MQREAATTVECADCVQKKGDRVSRKQMKNLNRYIYLQKIKKNGKQTQNYMCFIDLTVSKKKNGGRER